jgi:hypothetical protein
MGEKGNGEETIVAFSLTQTHRKRKITMTSKYHHDRQQNRWNQKHAQEKGTTYHFLKIPPSSPWVEATIANLPESSRFRLLSAASDFDALKYGLVGLSTLIHLPNPLLPQPPMGWKQVGITVVAEKDVVVPGLGMLASVQWRFALEWHPSRSAWDAILFSLDHLQLTAFALPPAYAIPALFLAFLADHSGDTLPPAHLSAWGPVLHETVQALDPFLMTLYEDWIDGPSRAAFRYRQFTEYMPTENTEHGPLLAPFRSILGTEMFEKIRGAEHLEATLLRTLCHASTRLWTKGTLPFPEQELALFLRSPHLHALLPLALWQSPSPIQQSLDATHLHSLNDVLHLWKQYVGIK